jgi:hypothetical protein
VKTPTHNQQIVDDDKRPLAALLLPDILVMLEESPDAIPAETEELHANDLATLAEALPHEMVAPFLSALPVERAADVLEYLDEDLRLRIGADEIRSRDAAVGLAAAWKPRAGSGDVHFADVQLFIESDTAAHAYLAVEFTSLDRDSGHATVDSRDASVSMARRRGEWVITAAEAKEMPQIR